MNHIDFEKGLNHMKEIKCDIQSIYDTINMQDVNYNLFAIYMKAYEAINNKDLNGYFKLRLEQDLYNVVAEYMHEIENLDNCEQNDRYEKEIRNGMCEMLDFYYDYIEENEIKVTSHILECWRKIQ